MQLIGWKGSGRDLFKSTISALLWDNEENLEKAARRTGFRAEIRARNLPKTKEVLHFSNEIRGSIYVTDIYVVISRNIVKQTLIVTNPCNLKLCTETVDRRGCKNIIGQLLLTLAYDREISTCSVQYTRPGYEVTGIMSLQLHLYTYNILRGVTLQVLPFSSYALSPTMLPLLETFLELLLWNSFHCRHHIPGSFQCPKIFIRLRQSLFLETARSYSEPNKGNRVRVLCQKSIFGPETAWEQAPCDLEHFHGGESSRWTKFQVFFYVQLT
jgi:hypothetical protein